MMSARRFEGSFVNIWGRCELVVFGLRYSVFGEPQGSGELWQTEVPGQLSQGDGILTRENASLSQSRHEQHDHARPSGESRGRRSGM